ncbi:MAG: cobalamin-independent methionine synthase II family protein [Proteobacteria bacterium]|nr:cobalamin-independent methionine synthase II family protein [Pseudomonadota bacterium]
MALTTTCLGAYPKPDYLPIKDWFQVNHDTAGYVDEVVRGYARATGATGADDLFDRATAEAVADQVACGIDIPTDGEMRRENYVHYQCRFFEGFDFENLEHRVLRNGAYDTWLPAIRGPIRGGETPVLARDWRVAQAATGRPVKITLPGPMTIADTTADCFYDDPKDLARDLAEALNGEILALAEAGCKYIQIDEPVFARQPEAALAYGVETLERCWHGVPEGVTRVVHVCCGYPNRIDDADYPKADPGAYRQIATALDGAVDQLSIEDSHRHNDLSLFARFRKTRLVVGFIDVASSRLESVDEIEARMREVAGALPEGHLIAAPDCGLGFLGRDLALAKLSNMCEAARRV